MVVTLRLGHFNFKFLAILILCALSKQYQYQNLKLPFTDSIIYIYITQLEKARKGVDGNDCIIYSATKLTCDQAFFFLFRGARESAVGRREERILPLILPTADSRADRSLE